MNYTLKDYFRRIRSARKTCKAADAIRQAREWLESGKSPYKIPAPSPIYYNPAKDGCRWIENPENGLRVKGYADEMAQRMNHKGWFIDDFQSEVYRGQVFQLPARDGKPRFLAGYEDAHGNDAAYIDFSAVFDDETEAAYAADRMAERDARETREYNEAWQAGSHYASLADDMKAEREDTRRLIAALREASPQAAVVTESARETICGVLRANIKRSLARLEKLRAERAALKANIWKDYSAAFNDGAGENVFPVIA